MKKANKIKHLILSARPFFNRLRAMGIAFGIFFIASCITVNVNFPESAVQRAADDFVRDLYQESAQATPVKGKSDKVLPTETKKLKRGAYFSLSLVSEAWAQELNMNDPKVQSIKAKMKNRIPDLNTYRNSGAICETSDGMLRAKDLKKAGADAAMVAKLVEAENADRDSLYETIQSINQITDRKQTRIRKFFSAAFRSQTSPAGICEE